MDFKDQIRQLGERTAKLKEQLLTEEATKNAFIMPFLQILGYDVFNPLEVVPEFISDVGIKKGEKIDYAIMKEGEPTILVECKHWQQKLDNHDSQLVRYFNVSKARFGILTNGIQYRFYSDLVAPNKMDEKPFLEFNLPEIKDAQIEELKKFHKSVFDVNSIVNTASELKLMGELRQAIHQEFVNPSTEFVKYFAKKVYTNGVLTAKVLEQFEVLTKRSLQFYVSDLITDRLKNALDKQDAVTAAVVEEAAVSSAAEDSKIETTQEELEGFIIVKSILRETVAVNRIHYRDSQTYFAILLDDNNRKTICRLYLNRSKKFFVLLNEAKQEQKFEITSLDDIFSHADGLKEVVGRLLD
jgi:hypothetical protein